MEAKIDITRKYLYQFDEPIFRERTKSRLTQMNEMGMEEVGFGEFGIKDVMSGLFIEKVWSYSNEAWNDYIDWVKSLDKTTHKKM